MSVILGSKIDHSELEALFRKVYPFKGSQFSSTYFCWRYERQFGANSYAIQVRKNGDLLGHGGIFVVNDGKGGKYALLGDLISDPQSRGLSTIIPLYKEAKKTLLRVNSDRVFTTPKERSAQVNRRILSLTDIAEASRTIALVSPMPTSRTMTSMLFGETGDQVERVEQAFMQASYDQAQRVKKWNATTLLNRLANPATQYHLHLSESSLTVTRLRTFRAVRIVEILLRIIRDGLQTPACELDVRQIAWYHRTPLISYSATGSTSQLQRFLQTRLVRLDLQFVVQTQTPRSTHTEGSQIELLDLDHS